MKRLTGESFVPVLVLDTGWVIKDSKNIVAGARDNPAGGAGRAASFGVERAAGISPGSARLTRRPSPGVSGCTESAGRPDDL